MNNDSSKTRVIPCNLAPLLAGFYERVAIKLGVDVALVIAVARGESRSKTIVGALRQELEATLSNTAREEVA